MRADDLLLYATIVFSYLPFQGQHCASVISFSLVNGLR
jgi:hypothetical protein